MSAKTTYKNVLKVDAGSTIKAKLGIKKTSTSAKVLALLIMSTPMASPKLTDSSSKAQPQSQSAPNICVAAADFVCEAFRVSSMAEIPKISMTGIIETRGRLQGLVQTGDYPLAAVLKKLSAIRLILASDRPTELFAAVQSMQDNVPLQKKILVEIVLAIFYALENTSDPLADKKLEMQQAAAQNIDAIILAYCVRICQIINFVFLLVLHEIAGFTYVYEPRWP